MLLWLVRYVALASNVNKKESRMRFLHFLMGIPARQHSTRAFLKAVRKTARLPKKFNEFIYHCRIEQDAGTALDFSNSIYMGQRVAAVMVAD